VLSLCLSIFSDQEAIPIHFKFEEIIVAYLKGQEELETEVATEICKFIYNTNLTSPLVYSELLPMIKLT